MAEEEEQAAANTIKIYQPTYQLEPEDTTACVWGRGARRETATGGLTLAPRRRRPPPAPRAQIPPLKGQKARGAGRGGDFEGPEVR